MAEQLFTCSRCHKKFISDLSKPEVMIELNLNFPSTAVKDTQPVCSGCYVVVLKDYRKVN